MIRSFSALILALWATGSTAEEMRLAVTTSFDSSGLADVLLPAIKEDLDLDVQLLVVGTGQALRLGEAGDVDAVLVHSKAAEEAFVAAGHGTHRREIMYNDFVLIGPATDTAGIADAASAADALQRIETAQSLFVSRGDDSGTHKAELTVWAQAGFDASTFDSWYRSVGAGMGQALNTAAAMDAYVLSDRASWLNFANKAELALLYSGDPALFNQYAYLPVAPAKNENVRNDLAMVLEAWLTGPRAEALINGYAINGETLFVFNAQPK
ncbi:substrate-binding domain-containing protein [Yoonia sp.]|uniref:substrate-binding domain-containing protein n=1 Tax=Yoonia sp. TaxID=2212373 RepID=UPI0025E8B9F0|nr:substrate-binding domain-containing protein [Yoonia sp.]